MPTKRPSAGGSGKTAAKAAKVSRPWCQMIMERAQSFNIDNGEHPVQWLLDTWTHATMLEPVFVWLEGITGTKVSWESCLPATAEKQTISGHFSLLMLDKPSEGLPVLTDWLRTAGDVWTVGYEAWRSPIEVCPLTDDVLGQAMKPCTLVPVKGVGRASIILFAVCYSYMNLRDMGPEELEDFSRFTKSVETIQMVLMPRQPIAVLNYRRIQMTEQQSEKQKMNALQKALIFTTRAKELQVEAPRTFSEFRDAFMEAIDEFNNYGAANFSERLRIDEGTASQLYGFKVGVCDEAWSMIENHLHRYRFADSAFSNAMLAHAQWLVGAGPSTGCNAVWHLILTVTAPKQVLFLRRILFLHDRAVRRGARAANLRLPLQDWCNECERMCLMESILREMKLAVDHGNVPVFEPGVVDKISKRAVDGDYNAELMEMLTLKESSFEPHHLTLWTENVTKKPAPAEVSFQLVDNEIDKLDKDARESAFRQDCLKLARDCAQLALIYKQLSNHDRAARLQKVTHLKQQNTVGADYVRKFMALNMKHVGGRSGELEGAMDEFMSNLQKLDKFKNDGGVVVWLDYTKYGKLTNGDLNDSLDLMKACMARCPEKVVGFIICPFLVSEKASVRGEIRRIEDKLDALSIYSELTMLRMSDPPGQKHVPLQFPAWVCFDEGSRASNVWKGNQLILDRCTRACLPWAAESSYVVPAPAKDSVPNSAEIRSLSQNQESAQLLSGDQLPEHVMSALLSKTHVKGVVGLVNLSPYDTWVELSAMKWGKKTNGETVMPSLSLSKNLTVVSYCDRSLSLRLMQDWKKGNHCMGSTAPKYEPEAPKVEDADISKFPLQVVRLEKNLEETSGWKKFKVTLPQTFRMHWLEDVVFSQEWRELLTDFDNKFGIPTRPAESVSAGTEISVQSLSPARAPWDGEPTTIQELTDRYLVETNLSGRTSGSTLYVVAAKQRDGSEHQVVEGQAFKLFLAAHMSLEVPLTEFQIGHGSAKFLKPEKFAALQREGKPGECQRLFTVEWKSDLDMVVLEIPQDGTKATVDSDRSTWRTLLQELETEAEIIDATINSHNLKHANSDQGDDVFVIEPKPKPCVFQWNQPAAVNTCKWSSIASAFPAEALKTSKMLTMSWRVSYAKESNEISPRKPLYFLKGTSDLKMEQDEVLRLV